MSTYHNSYNDTELLKVKTKIDQLRELQNKTEKHAQENTLNSLKIDDEYYKKKYKKLKTKESTIKCH